jgi:8-oxo-dGTP pyrophosphatase MutT (NUDIX family)
VSALASEPEDSEPEDTAPPDWPPAGAVIRRSTARVLPVAPDGRVLLLHGWEPARPDNPFWFTIGGAAEDGESLREAAARELLEEAGISVEPARLGSPIAQNTIEFSWSGRHVIQEQTFFAVAVDSAQVSFAGQDQWERSTIDKHGWFTAAELRADGGAVHPDIPGLIATATATITPTPPPSPG